MKRFKEFTIEINIVIDIQFWAILPAVNININSRELEFEFLCLGIYLGIKK